MRDSSSTLNRAENTELSRNASQDFKEHTSQTAKLQPCEFLHENLLSANPDIAAR